MIYLWTDESEATQRVMSRDEVRGLDRWAIEKMHIPGVVLMENAGRSVAEVLWEELKGLASPSAAIFCGTGNNGGDGFVIARHLRNRGCQVRILLCGAREKVRGDALVNFRVVEAMQIPVMELQPDADSFLALVREGCAGADWLVDAYLGTGLAGELSDAAGRVIAAMDSVGQPILAVDIPSGLDCDLGVPLPVCVEAKITVTLAAMKKGFVANPESRQATGKVYVASIGIDTELYSA